MLSRPLALPQVPFLLTPEAKSRILRAEALMQQQQQLNQAALQVRAGLGAGSWMPVI